MAVHLGFLLILIGLTGIHSLTTVSKVSVRAGGSITIPCLYESHVTLSGLRTESSGWYLCFKGDLQMPVHITVTEKPTTRQTKEESPATIMWSEANRDVDVMYSSVVAVERIHSITTVSKVSSRAGGSITVPCLYESKQRVFTVTINYLTGEDTGDYWCAVEIDDGADLKEYFHLSVPGGSPSLYVDQQEIRGFKGDNMNIKCHYQNSGERKWCRLGGSFVTNPYEHLKSFGIRVAVVIFVVMVTVFIWFIYKRHRIHSITTVSKVSVRAGGSITIPCLYESKYINNVKYLCKGFTWYSCSYKIKTNKPSSSGKFSISDDKKQRVFTVTINDLTEEDTGDYWCAVEINGGSDSERYFHLSVTGGKPYLYVDEQKRTGFRGEDITIDYHYHNVGDIKWCRLGSSCVTWPNGSLDNSTVTIKVINSKVLSVNMSGLRTESSGWYLCVKGDLQMPVQITVTEKQRNLEIFIIPLSLLIFIVMVAMFIWFMFKKHRIHSITTVSKVSVRAGGSITVPCLYESQYKNNVKYLCQGYYWNSCSDKVRTNKPSSSGKCSISEDKKQRVFTVTINDLTEEDTGDYWCAVEINGGYDSGTYFHLSVNKAKGPAALEPVKHTTEPVKHIPEPVKHTTEPVKHTTEPVKHLLEPVKHTTEPVKHLSPADQALSTVEVEQQSVSGNLKIFVIRWSLLIIFAMVNLFILFMYKRQEQTIVESSSTTTVEAEDEDVTYSNMP
ncbi:CMRF35-like molecule 7 [Dissostichus eleginoides]|uniref:CMRF35-like molecule 7 n=1 Tax=Dissostichus eleginoides TaxID=100907 RepID=A0AAD9CUA5_DISEL|nr:CMRF35-like molecule 7 [Dissostichus eleginoides]